ncbi:alpha/beta fold hydrolase [Arachnia rubra]|jgi:hydrolase, alpha/beta domain protein|uniref:Alpha/beta hydrolase n=1 Tax=Arachnia rubra TaxID=1547448 RepID=A0ABX7Y268_9ACTN|nr:alpha/beta hydrolase [Arachnia rubra]MBB1571641.1 alpha/beta hydrolase [Propionibacterium sp.]MDO4644476.1 alpha/beta hydrolase [Propionibacteriaceae bacterium]MBB1576852.1 alpha/beta hydrolase [Propionibacterium sp.]QUC06975.1 alpha/beta hydrolase [Arachnia rubra]BCR81203.1 alpha/beta hydrolase [Arachnia rubra]
MIHYITTGSGPIQLVFLHGLFGQGKNFSRIAAALADVATCHLPDLPNHGASSWTVGFSLDGQAEHIARWLQKSFASPVALVGHSLGGKLAMRLALSHPEMVDRLLVADISPAPSDGPSSFAPLVGAMHSLDLEHLTSRTEASRRLSTAIPDPQVRGFLLQNLRRLSGDWAWMANLDLLGDSLGTIGGWPHTDAVYDGPVWWVAGGQSSYVQPEHAEPMRRLFPRVVTITLKRAGHWVHADDPEAFTSICREFLASPAGRTQPLQQTVS